MSAAFLLLPALLVGLAFADDVLTAALLFLTAGLLSASINVFVITLVQLETAPELRARVLAVVFGLAQAAMPLGMALGGIAGDMSGMRVSAVLFVSGSTGLFVCAFAVRSIPLRRLLARAH
ncbi:MAG TPA: hypothetical protein VMN60_04820 [Longimicrobiales bacterium]|nr:hypothetical protein [Longimicrobiales bacterium]